MEDASASMGVDAFPAGSEAGASARHQDDNYLDAAREFGQALQRLARAYEASEELQRDLLQEIHLALWRSFAVFDGRCAVRTWVYRVAHNVAASHVERQRRWGKGLCGLDQVDDVPASDNTERAHDERSTLERLFALIHALKPLDREVISLFLEDLDARLHCGNHRPVRGRRRDENSSHQGAAGQPIHEAGFIMSGDTTTDALKQAWLGQSAPSPGISLADVKRASKKFHRFVRVRNLIEYAAAVFVIVGYSQMMLKVQKPLVQIGCVLIVIATLYVVVQIHVRMSSQDPPTDALGGTFVDFHRAAVLRQIAGLESTLFWYLLPFAPGWSLFIVQAVLERAWASLTFLLVSALVVGFGLVALNNWAARRLRGKLEEFDALGVHDAQGRAAA